MKAKFLLNLLVLITFTALSSMGQHSFSTSGRSATSSSSSEFISKKNIKNDIKRNTSAIPGKTGGIILTQSLSNAITPNNSVACNPTAHNAISRVFRLNDYLTGGFDLDNVMFGLESTFEANVTTSVNIYKLSGTYVLANLTLLASESVVIGSANNGQYINVPIHALFNPGDTMVVEIEYTTSSSGLWLASNNLGQTGPSYIRATSCGISEPIEMTAIGFPHVQWVMELTGTETSISSPEVHSFNIRCNGENNGQIQLIGFQDGTKFSIDGQNYYSNTIIDSLAPGTYVLRSRYNGVVTVEDTIEITEPSMLSLDEVVFLDSQNCFIDSLLGFEISASGGTPPYLYSIDGGISYQSSSTFSGLSPGLFELVVKDDTSCTAATSFTITPETGDYIPKITDITHISCHGANDGSVTVTVVPQEVLSYSSDSINWQGSNVLTGLSPGNHKIYIKNASNCVWQEDVHILEPNDLVFSAIQTEQILCHGDSSASISLSLSGGAGTVELSYNGSTFGTFQSLFEDLAPGNHHFTVRDTNGCEESDSVVVTEPSAMTGIASILSHVSCFGGNDGVITIVANGGTPPYSYTYDGGISYGASSSNNLMSAGSHSIMIKDANNCIYDLGNWVVQEPDELTITDLNTVNVSCDGSEDGAIFLTASGGVEPYQFSLDGSTYKFGSAFNNLAPGNYTGWVKDAKGCISSSGSITVGAPSSLSAYIVTIHNVTCFGGTNGGATINIQGGTPPYTYKLGTRTTVGYSIQNSPAGTFAPVVTDANGCSLTMSPITIIQPSELTINTNAQDFPNCNEGQSGSIEALVNGGTPPYHFLHNGDSVGTSTLIEGLGVGSHTITVVDAEGCVVSANPVTFMGPSLISIDDIKITEPDCFGGLSTIIVTPGGNTSGVSYSIDGVNFQFSNLFENLTAGTYTVTAMNANNCQASVEITISQPADLQVDVEVSEYQSCLGNDPATVTLTAFGGTPPYAYRIGISGFQANGVFNNLDAGTYNFTIIDSKGCSEFITDININDYAPMQMSAFVDEHVDCFAGNNGRIVGVVNNGTPPFTYTLSGVGSQSSGVFDNLPIGDYTLTITDALGCSVEETGLVITQPDELSGGVVILNNLECPDDNDGILQGWGTGGTLPYEYSLDGVSYTSESIFTGLGSGTYRVYVRDGNGCVFLTTSAILNSPARMNISTQANDVSCNGHADGEILISVTGGNPPYQYATSAQGPWSSNNVIGGLSGGAQFVFVRGSGGCVQYHGIVNISEPGVLSLSANTSPERTYKDGQITMTASGGTPPYHYHYYAHGIWNNSLNPAVNWLQSGDYIIAVTDINGCTDSSMVSVGNEVGLQEQAQLEVTLYPNPSSGNVVIEMDQTHDKTDFEVLNSLGEIVFSRSVINQDRVQLDLQTLSHGMYYVRVSSMGEVVVKPLLIQQ